MAGSEGKSLNFSPYQSLFRRSLTWYILTLALCSTLSILSIVYVYSGPKISPARRVLRTGSLKVDQFYSGLILSLVLAPVGFLIRMIWGDISSGHPFAIASEHAVAMDDFNRITNPGPLSLLSVARYSAWRSLVQATLMSVGWVFIPVGTLIITTGPFIPPTAGTGLVGMATCNGPVCPLRAAMNAALANATSTSSFRPALNKNDLFLDMVASAFKGSLLGRSDSMELGSIPRELGAVPRSSLTYAPGVAYHNILTYTWAGNCEAAEADISYVISGDQGAPTVNFTFPDGSTSTAHLDRSIMTKRARMFFSGGTRNTNSSQAAGINATLYGAIASLHATPLSNVYDEQVANLTGGTGIRLDRDVWISRQVCRPALKWRVASCTWDGTFMRNCNGNDTATESGAEAVELDTVALDSLTQYMSAVLWKLYNDGDMLLTWSPYPAYAPTTQHVENIQGVLAMSIVSVASMSSWGTVKVQTTGEPQRQVYIVRVYVLFLVSGMLILVTLLSALDLVQDILSRRPTWNTRFLSITAAVRGQWWEEAFGGHGKTEPVVKDGIGKRKIRFTSDGSGRLVPEDEYLDASARRRSLDSFSSVDKTNPYQMESARKGTV